MNKQSLIEEIKKKKSFLCIGLDTDIEKIPPHLKSHPDPVAEFNRQIIEATKDLCVAYKPNIAFYESLGAKGFESLMKTKECIPSDCFSIADAKRGDIGNTANLYARTFFNYFGFDSVTVNPYMGKDSVSPFLETEGKWAIVLALTSNKGAEDFQLKNSDGKKMYEQVLSTCKSWGHAGNMMFVAGATRADMLASIRSIVPDHFLLVPGVGAQGGSLRDVSHYGMNAECGLLVNSSRQIIYASCDKDFADRAREEALKVQQEMEALLKEKKVI